MAIVGVSNDPMRPSHGVWQYLRAASDYTLYLVNPTISEIDGTVSFTVKGENSRSTVVVTAA